MAQTISKTQSGQIIGGIFSNRLQADNALKAFEALPILPDNIQVVEHLTDKEIKNAYIENLVARGVSPAQAHYYDKEVRSGKIFVAIHGVQKPGPVIHIFDKYHATHNPDGSRNLRDDVVGMTTGVAVGAVVGGVIGTVVGGPVGGLAGVAAGALVGGGTGAAVGTIAENKK